MAVGNRTVLDPRNSPKVTIWLERRRNNKNYFVGYANAVHQLHEFKVH